MKRKKVSISFHLLSYGFGLATIVLAIVRQQQEKMSEWTCKEEEEMQNKNERKKNTCNGDVWKTL
jgi:hypothetical protein